MQSRLCDQSGGLIYHLRALRYRKTLWRPFHEQVRAWLEGWQPPETALLIVGPSAGYALPEAWLRRFARIDILEPDPLARWLLARRFPDLRFYAGELDCFAEPKGPQRLAQAYPHHAVLFSNLIGQLPDPHGAWKRAIVEALRGRSWASYHDLVSSETAPRGSGELRLAAGAPLEEILAYFWQGELEIRDHETLGFMDQENVLTAYAPWSLTPNQHHLVAWSCMMVV